MKECRCYGWCSQVRVESLIHDSTLHEALCDADHEHYRARVQAQQAEPCSDIVQ